MMLAATSRLFCSSRKASSGANCVSCRMRSSSASSGSDSSSVTSFTALLSALPPAFCMISTLKPSTWSTKSTRSGYTFVEKFSRATCSCSWSARLSLPARSVMI